MGLDSVEILMEIEDVFDIQLEDAEAEKMRTPGDLIESVLSKVSRADVTVCLTQRAFNLLRKALLRALPLKRRQIAPAVPLGDLVAKNARDHLIARLATELNTGPLPELVRPPWLERLLGGLALTTGLGVLLALFILAPSWSGGLMFFVSALAAVLVGFLAWIVTSAFCTEFPPLAATVGDLARWVMVHKPDLARPSPGRWTREQIAARVREIIIEKLDCADTYREDALLVKDLGLS